MFLAEVTEDRRAMADSRSWPHGAATTPQGRVNAPAHSPYAGSKQPHAHARSEHASLDTTFLASSASISECAALLPLKQAAFGLVIGHLVAGIRPADEDPGNAGKPQKESDASNYRNLDGDSQDCQRHARHRGHDIHSLADPVRVPEGVCAHTPITLQRRLGPQTAGKRS